MAIRTLFTKGYGNGTFSGAISSVVLMGYTPPGLWSKESGTAAGTWTEEGGAAAGTWTEEGVAAAESWTKESGL